MSAGQDETDSTLPDPQHFLLWNSPHLSDTPLHEQILGRRQVSQPPVGPMWHVDRDSIGRTESSVGSANEPDDRVDDRVQILVGHQTERDGGLDARWDDRGT